MSELRDRNRRFKALACLGAPVLAFWGQLAARRFYPYKDDEQLASQDPTRFFVLKCLECDAEMHTKHLDPVVDYATEEGRTLETFKRYFNCTHLDVLLEPDPEELETLKALALLEKPERL